MAFFYSTLPDSALFCKIFTHSHSLPPLFFPAGSLTLSRLWTFLITAFICTLLCLLSNEIGGLYTLFLVVAERNIRSLPSKMQFRWLSISVCFEWRAKLFRRVKVILNNSPKKRICCDEGYHLKSSSVTFTAQTMAGSGPAGGIYLRCRKRLRISQSCGHWLWLWPGDDHGTSTSSEGGGARGSPRNDFTCSSRSSLSGTLSLYPLLLLFVATFSVMARRQSRSSGGAPIRLMENSSARSVLAWRVEEALPSYGGVVANVNCRLTGCR